MLCVVCCVYFKLCVVFIVEGREERGKTCVHMREERERREEKRREERRQEREGKREERR